MLQHRNTNKQINIYIYIHYIYTYMYIYIYLYMVPGALFIRFMETTRGDRQMGPHDQHEVPEAFMGPPAMGTGSLKDSYSILVA